MRSGKIHEKAISAGQSAVRNKKNVRRLIHRAYRLLLKRFGPRGWWPITLPGRLKPEYVKERSEHLNERQIFEICVGAILAQNSAWTNVEKAIVNLNKARAVSPRKIKRMNLERLSSLIKPSGYFRQKAIKLKEFSRYVMSFSVSLKEWFSGDTADLRRHLLAIHGIGPETADSILLYAAGKPKFIADAYTLRIFSRMGFERLTNYAEGQEFFEKNLGPNVYLYQEYHALIVELGKNFCKKREPLCEKCPLTKLCQKKI